MAKVRKIKTNECGASVNLQRQQDGAKDLVPKNKENTKPPKRGEGGKAR